MSGPDAHRHAVGDAGCHGEPRAAERGHEVGGAQSPNAVAPQDARHAARRLDRPAVRMRHGLEQRPQPGLVGRRTEGEPRRIDPQELLAQPIGQPGQVGCSDLHAAA